VRRSRKLVVVVVAVTRNVVISVSLTPTHVRHSRSIHAIYARHRVTLLRLVLSMHLLLHLLHLLHHQVPLVHVLRRHLLRLAVIQPAASHSHPAKAQMLAYPVG
jgi:hypothetical protein